MMQFAKPDVPKVGIARGPAVFSKARCIVELKGITTNHGPNRQNARNEDGQQESSHIVAEATAMSLLMFLKH
jgi:hypothetical protein